MWFSLFLLIFYTTLVGGAVFFTVKLIKRWSAKYIIISKDELDPVSADKAGSTKTKQILNRSHMIGVTSEDDYNDVAL